MNGLSLAADLTAMTRFADEQHFRTESNAAVSLCVPERYGDESAIAVIFEVFFSDRAAQFRRKRVVPDADFLAPREECFAAVLSKQAVHFGLICDRFDILRSDRHGIPQQHS